MLLQVFLRRRISRQLEMMVSRALGRRSRIYIMLGSFACVCRLLLEVLLDEL